MSFKHSKKLKALPTTIYITNSAEEIHITGYPTLSKAKKYAKLLKTHKNNRTKLFSVWTEIDRRDSVSVAFKMSLKCRILLQMPVININFRHNDSIQKNKHNNFTNITITFTVININKNIHTIPDCEQEEEIVSERGKGL